MDREAEGRPLSGRLPLELQQIRDQNKVALTLAERRRSEDTKASERNILKIRRRSFGETSVSPEDATTRRSSRAIKRRKFDDEKREFNSLSMTIVTTSSAGQQCAVTTPPPHSSVESRQINNMLSYAKVDNYEYI